MRFLLLGFGVQNFPLLHRASNARASVFACMATILQVGPNICNKVAGTYELIYCVSPFLKGMGKPAYSWPGLDDASMLFCITISIAQC